jgi:hypothetical protein
VRQYIIEDCFISLSHIFQDIILFRISLRDTLMLILVTNIEICGLSFLVQNMNMLYSYEISYGLHIKILKTVMSGTLCFPCLLNKCTICK